MVMVVEGKEDDDMKKKINDEGCCYFFMQDDSKSCGQILGRGYWDKLEQKIQIDSSPVFYHFRITVFQMIILDFF